MWLWSALDEQACHVRRYSQIELKQKVEKAGFQVIASTSFISFLVPFMWLSRQRLNKKPASSQGELQPPAWLNLCFWSVMQLEIIFLKLGVRLPVGGSLILVAQKP